MDTVDATHLKNHLGEVLEQATLGPVAIERHGRIVAYLVPAPIRKPARGDRASESERGWNRLDEERAIELCVGGDFRPSRWRRAGNPKTLAGVAAMLASDDRFDRTRMLALAEQLYPGMSTLGGFNRWLATAPVQAARFLPMLRARIQESHSRSDAVLKLS
jgi:antitoxin (DNA-binding transcriptional repressor) of toxin-antitoxin stability system